MIRKRWSTVELLNSEETVSCLGHIEYNTKSIHPEQLVWDNQTAGSVTLLDVHETPVAGETLLEPVDD